MAKTSILEREKKRAKLGAKFKVQRQAYRKIIDDPNVDMIAKLEAQRKLQSLPRNSAICRQRRRCLLTGRPRGVMRRVGLCMAAFRKLMRRGELAGFTTSSW